MARQVPWCKIIVETFIEEAQLNEEEVMVIRTRVAGWTRSRQCRELNISMSTLDRMIARLKSKYDYVQKFNPILPPRRTSPVEEFLDKN